MQCRWDPMSPRSDFRRQYSWTAAPALERTINELIDKEFFQTGLASHDESTEIYYFRKQKWSDNLNSYLQ